MGHFGYKELYSRRRPHLHPLGTTLFVTFRLANSVPKSEIRKWTALRERHRYRFKRLAKLENNQEIVAKAEKELLSLEREWFRRFEELLHLAKFGPRWLANERIRKVVESSIRSGEGKDYRIESYCIMSNHVHLVFTPTIAESDLSPAGTPLTNESPKTFARIMQAIKGGSARQANTLLGRSGAFWEHESYDHFVRGREEMFRILRYTINNPVKAKLVKSWRNWPGTYLASRYEDWFD